MRAALLLLLPLLAACRDAPPVTRAASDTLARAAGPDRGRAHNATDTVALLDTSAYALADRCCTFSGAPPTLDVETLAGLHAQHFYTDYEAPAKADCVRPPATEAVRMQADGVKASAFVVMPPDSLMAVEVVQYTDGRTAAIAHSGCESLIYHLRFTAPGADDAAPAPFLVQELQALVAATTLPVALGPVADALAKGPLPENGRLDEMTTVELHGHGTLPGGHRYADLMVRYGPL